MKIEKVFKDILKCYDVEITKMISTKYHILPMKAFGMFLNSKTYEMLEDISLVMYEFSPIAIFDMYDRYHIESLNNAFMDIDELIKEKEELLF